MKLPLKELLSVRYLYVSPENIVHVFMPIVGGTNIGLDNTCKAVYALQGFFNKGSNSTKKISLKGELLAYKEALEYDLSILGAYSELVSQKQARLSQIEAYLKVLTVIEKHPELDCLNSGFPSYPRPLEEFMQDRTNSNLFSMILRPSAEDGFLRLEAANPVFSVAHKSASRQIEGAQSKLQQALIQAYTPLTFEVRDLKSQVIQRVLAKLKEPHIPVDFTHLRKILSEEVKALIEVDIDFNNTQQDTPIFQEKIDNAMGFNPKTASSEDYIEALFGYCAGSLFDTLVESPFNYLTQAEQWSIATQFLLGITNIYAVVQGKMAQSTNLGTILDRSMDLSTALAQTIAKAQQNKASIEEACLHWMNEHAEALTLKTPFTVHDIEAIKQDFANRYTQIKDAPHFDEFFVLATQKEGHFVIHQGSICTSFAKFVSSPLLSVPQELTQPLEMARNQANRLGVDIAHQNSLVVQDEMEIVNAN